MRETWTWSWSARCFFGALFCHPPSPSLFSSPSLCFILSPSLFCGASFAATSLLLPFPLVHPRASFSITFLLSLSLFVASLTSLLLIFSISFFPSHSLPSLAMLWKLRQHMPTKCRNGPNDLSKRKEKLCCAPSRRFVLSSRCFCSIQSHMCRM